MYRNDKWHAHTVNVNFPPIRTLSFAAEVIYSSGSGPSQPRHSQQMKGREVHDSDPKWSCIRKKKMHIMENYSITNYSK